LLHIFAQNKKNTLAFKPDMMFKNSALATGSALTVNTVALPASSLE
jgi:spore maturation protein CgeB